MNAQVQSETARVCARCLVLVANGDDTPEGEFPPMGLLDGVWYYVGHGWDDDSRADCETCSAPDGEYCETVDGEAGRNWRCEGCGDVPGMFAEAFLIWRGR